MIALHSPRNFLAHIPKNRIFSTPKCLNSAPKLTGGGGAKITEKITIIIRDGINRKGGKANYRALGVAREGVGDDEAVERAGPRGEPCCDHVVDDAGRAGGIATASAVHQFLHEGEPQIFLQS